MGEQLAVARKKQHVSLKAASQRLGIKGEYLKNLEEGNYQKLPGEIYAKNFLKAYCKFLELDIEKHLQLYQQERSVYQKLDQFQEEPTRLVARVSRRQLVITPKILRRGLMILILVICLIYLGLEVKKIVAPPWLTIDQPVNNLRTADYSLEVRGTVEKEANLLINGQEVMANSGGQFSKKIDLQAGVNIIKISAAKKHSPANVVYRQVLVENELSQ